MEEFEKDDAFKTISLRSFSKYLELYKRVKLEGTLFMRINFGVHPKEHT